jgi:hypothetical protein
MQVHSLINMDFVVNAKILLQIFQQNTVNHKEIMNVWNYFDTIINKQ